MDYALWIMIIGAVLFLWGLYYQLVSFREDSKLALMENTKTSKIYQLEGEISCTPKNKSKKYHKTVELKGRGVFDQPLQSRIMKKPCFYYKSSVILIYEEKHTSRDKHGNINEYWVEQQEELLSQEERIPFFLDDGSGKIEINPKGAELYLEETVNDFFGKDSLFMTTDQGHNLPQARSYDFNPDKRIVSYAVKEKIIPADHDLYVLGELRIKQDGYTPLIRRPRTGKFIISTKSEEELMKIKGKELNFYLYTSVFMILAGLYLIYYAYPYYMSETTPQWIIDFLKEWNEFTGGVSD